MSEDDTRARPHDGSPDAQRSSASQDAGETEAARPGRQRKREGWPFDDQDATRTRADAGDDADLIHKAERAPVTDADEHPGPDFTQPRSPFARPQGNPEPAAASTPATTPEPASASAPASAAATDDVDQTIKVDRPENPFEPKPEPATKKSWLGRLGVQRDPDAERVGKRVAERQRRWWKLPGRTQGTRAARRKPSRRDWLALAVAGVALVCAIALVASYLWWSSHRPSAAGQASNQATNAAPGPVLTESMLLPDSAGQDLDAARSWQRTLTQEGIKDNSPTPVCTTAQSSGRPSSQATFLRTLSASGDDQTAALQRADAYATPEEAAQVFGFRSTEFGDCAGSPLLIDKGYELPGLGNQAIGLQVVLQDQTPQYRTLVLVRTGRVVNIVDVARNGAPIAMEAVAKAAAKTVDRECGSAVGLCTAPDMSVKQTIPPPGGDDPGFLTSADLPRISKGVGSWKGTGSSEWQSIREGTMCEAVPFDNVGGAKAKNYRIYLLRNDPQAPQGFGVDQVVETMANPNDANALVDKINQSVTSCEPRVMTAKTSRPVEVQGQGADNTAMRGYAYTVTHKLPDNKSAKYRGAVIAVGAKVIYLRSNPTDKFDFSDQAWEAIAKRAGERATQTR